MRQGTNSPLMKLNNRRLVLDLIRRQPISRAEVAKTTGLTRASVTLIADELIGQGLIRETHPVASGVGRRPMLMEIVPMPHSCSFFAVSVSISVPLLVMPQ